MTAYDIEKRKPYFFKTSAAQNSKDRDHFLKDVARATSAAPTFFEPKIVKSMANKPTRRVLVDGGVFVNNPAMCAYVEAMSLKQEAQDILLLSLGTGIATRKIKYEDAKDWGKLGWVVPIISVMMDGEADAADYHLRHLLPDERKGKLQRYFRLDTELDLANDDMDAVDDKNIQDLKKEAAQILDTEAAQLKRLISLLR